MGFVRDIGFAILFAIPGLFICVAILATQGVAFITGAILDWVISPSFISLSYTIPCPPPDFTPGPPNCNPVIGIGLSITQSFVNLILVVALVYVAFSIALRIDEKKAQSSLAKLIVVALLVNFMPVFCGLVIDAANIIMNYFLRQLQGGVSGVLTQISPYIETIWKAIWGAGGELPNKLGLLALGVVQIVLNISIIMAFLLFATLFIMRYIMLWLLVILAPLAFAASILPQSKKAWDSWWSQFICWSFIGVPLAFFLYLGITSFSVISESFRADLEAPGIEPEITGLFDEMFPFIITVAFLFLGFGIGLTILQCHVSTAIIRGFQAAHRAAQAGTLGYLGKTALRGMRHPIRTLTAPAKAIKGVAGTVGEIRRGYRSLREEGAGKKQALRTAVSLGWHDIKQRARERVREGAKASAKTGILSVVKNTADAFKKGAAKKEEKKS